MNEQTYTPDQVHQYEKEIPDPQGGPQGEFVECSPEEAEYIVVPEPATGYYKRVSISALVRKH